MKRKVWSFIVVLAMVFSMIPQIDAEAALKPGKEKAKAELVCVQYTDGITDSTILKPENLGKTKVVPLEELPPLEVGDSIMVGIILKDIGNIAESIHGMYGCCITLKFDPNYLECEDAKYFRTRASARVPKSHRYLYEINEEDGVPHYKLAGGAMGMVPGITGEVDGCTDRINVCMNYKDVQDKPSYRGEAPGVPNEVMTGVIKFKIKAIPNPGKTVVGFATRGKKQGGHAGFQTMGFGIGNGDGAYEIGKLGYDPLSIINYDDSKANIFPKTEEPTGAAPTVTITGLGDLTAGNVIDGLSGLKIKLTFPTNPSKTVEPTIIGYGNAGLTDSDKGSLTTMNAPYKATKPMDGKHLYAYYEKGSFKKMIDLGVMKVKNPVKSIDIATSNIKKNGAENFKYGDKIKEVYDKLPATVPVTFVEADPSTPTVPKADLKWYINGNGLNNEEITPSNNSMISAGMYTVTAKTPDGAVVASNNLNLVIDKAELTVKANDKTVAYGDNIASFDVSITGWKGTDSESLSGFVKPTAKSGTFTSGMVTLIPNGSTGYNIDVANDGNPTSNYTFKKVSGKLTVNKRDISITGARVKAIKAGSATAINEELSLVDTIDPVGPTDALDAKVGFLATGILDKDKSLVKINATGNYPNAVEGSKTINPLNLSIVAGKGNDRYNLTTASISNAKGRVVAKVLESVKIKSQNSITFKEGQTITEAMLNGLVVEIKYEGESATAVNVSDFASKDITLDIKGEAIDLGTTKAKMAYNGKPIKVGVSGSLKSANTNNVTVTPKAVSAISIKTQPAKMIYTIDELINISDLRLKLTYDDGTDSDATDAAGVPVDNRFNVSIANGVKAAPAHDGKKIEISLKATPSVKATTANALTIKAKMPTLKATNKNSIEIVNKDPRFEYAIVKESEPAPVEGMYKDTDKFENLDKNESYKVYAKLKDQDVSKAVASTVVKTFKYEVSVVGNGGTSIAKFFVNDGNLAESDVKAVVGSKYKFYKEQAFTTPYAFPVNVTSDIVIYAKQQAAPPPGGGGGGAITPAPNQEIKLEVSPSEITGPVGESKTITAKVTGSNDTPVFKSEDEKIATVDSNGKVKFIAVGETKITVTAAGKSETVKVIVTEEDGSLINEKLTKPYIYGLPGDIFGTEINISRGEVAAIIARILKVEMDKNKTYPSKYTDVKADDWYANYVGFLSDFDIIKGFTDGTFRANEKVSRAELVAMVARAARYKEVTTGKFSDVSPGYWAAGYIGVLSNKNVIAGYPDGTFGPARKITRAETVKIIQNMLDKSRAITDKQFKDVSPSYWAADVIKLSSNERELLNK